MAKAVLPYNADVHRHSWRKVEVQGLLTPNIRIVLHLGASASTLFLLSDMLYSDGYRQTNLRSAPSVNFSILDPGGYNKRIAGDLRGDLC